MITIYTNNASCPYCIKTTDSLKMRNIPYDYRVVDKTLINDKFPKATTVPQIVEGTHYIGGYDDLIIYLAKQETGLATQTGRIDGTIENAANKPKTVFNVDNKGHETGIYPLFFGEQLGFADSITSPYPILDDLYQTQMSQIWNEFEIDLTQDRQDMLNVERPIVDLMVLNLLWQTLVDSVASRAITGLLMEYVTNSDLEAYYNAVALFETIHNKTYNHIIKQTFVDPLQGLRDGYENKQVIQRATSITNAFNRVANLDQNAPESEKKEAVYLSIVALYLLESINFMNSFSITFGVAETGIFAGISQNVTLICRDELLHAKGGKEILKIEAKELLVMKPQMQQLFDDVVREEKEWNAYLFSEGRQCIGINEKLSNEYINFLAKPIAENLGLEEVEAPAKTPYPFMDNCLDSSKVQVAAQELQLTSYLLNSIQSSSKETIDTMLARVKGEFL
jgi:ribonucleoside-diphosphate reductase beta chain